MMQHDGDLQPSEPIAGARPAAGSKYLICHRFWWILLNHSFYSSVRTFLYG
jgi:hypothetical protein